MTASVSSAYSLPATGVAVQGPPFATASNRTRTHASRTLPSSAAERIEGDAEVQLGFDLEQALAETVRCFSCGTCTHCDNCVRYCPDLAVQRANGDGGGYVVLADYCKGCGICVRECPTGSMKMIEEAR
jgi:Pyruvate/2-oxoacid:ferredoxin oxidoreductase delta subunit